MGNVQKVPIHQQISHLDTLKQQIEEQRTILRQITKKLAVLDDGFYKMDTEIYNQMSLAWPPLRLSDEEKIEQYERMYPGKIKRWEHQYNLLLTQKKECVEKIKKLDKDIDSEPIRKKREEEWNTL